jgi:hypothetical protein
LFFIEMARVVAPPGRWSVLFATPVCSGRSPAIIEPRLGLQTGYCTQAIQVWHLHGVSREGAPEVPQVVGHDGQHVHLGRPLGSGAVQRGPQGYQTAKMVNVITGA